MLDLFELVPAPWKDHLSDLEETFRSLERFLSSEPDLLSRLCPSIEKMFSSLDLAPEAVKVVIVGQDPYPNRQHAIGRAFAVPIDTTPLPGSLKNIIREKMDDVAGEIPHADLLSWRDQGVMLINTVFTTIEGRSGAHSKIGWEEISMRVMQVVSEKGAAALLWGRAAQGYEHFFTGRAITGVHPSPLSAHRGFFGSRPFSKINEFLDHPIQW